MGPIPVGCDGARVERSIARVLKRAGSNRRLDRSRKSVNRVELVSLSSQVCILQVVERDGCTLLLG
jgi:hypothetical protein